MGFVILKGLLSTIDCLCIVCLASHRAKLTTNKSFSQAEYHFFKAAGVKANRTSRSFRAFFAKSVLINLMGQILIQLVLGQKGGLGPGLDG